MKKTVIFTVLLCIVALSCAYAGKASLVAQVSPYSLQTVSASEGAHVSSYGYGAKAGFRYDVWNNLNLGVDVDFSIYRFEELDSQYNILSARALVGYRYDFSTSLFAQAELGVALEMRNVAEARARSVGMNLYLGCGHGLGDRLAVTVGTDVGMEFQKGNGGVVTGFALRTQVGALMTM